MRNVSRSNVFVTVALLGAVLGCSHSRRNTSSTTATTAPSTATPTTATTTTTTTTPTTTTTVTPTTVTPTTTTLTTTTNPHLLYALQLINAQRALRGLPLFVLDPALSACALRHSVNWDGVSGNQIANAPLTAHRDFASGDDCGAFAENQGVGQGPIDPAFKTVFDSMMSEGAPNVGQCNHYGNLMDPTFTRIGIGIFEDNGNVWITEVFGR